MEKTKDKKMIDEVLETEYMKTHVVKHSKVIRKRQKDPRTILKEGLEDFICEGWSVLKQSPMVMQWLTEKVQHILAVQVRIVSPRNLEDLVITTLDKEHVVITANVITIFSNCVIELKDALTAKNDVWIQRHIKKITGD